MGNTNRKSPVILCARHGEGQHLKNMPFNKTAGPSLTTNGKIQCYERCSR